MNNSGTLLMNSNKMRATEPFDEVTKRLVVVKTQDISRFWGLV